MCGVNLLRRAMHREAERQWIVSGGAFEQLRLGLDSLQLGVGDDEVAGFRGYILQCDGDKPVGIRIGERAQKYSVDY